MKFLSDLFGRKRASEKPADSSIENFADVAARNEQAAGTPNTDQLLQNVNERVGDKTPKNNIWDMDEDLPPVEALEEIRPAIPTKSPSRARRTKTRLIGFESTDGVVDLFNDTATPKAAPTKTAKFPVGWVLGHGGKSNIVRLNDTPVISNEAVKDGDLIRIGETTLRFTPLCSEAFNWNDTNTGDDEESDDVAIA